MAVAIESYRTSILGGFESKERNLFTTALANSSIVAGYALVIN